MKQGPLKRNEHIAKLSRDHHASLMFCWKIRQGINREIELSRLADYVRYFSNHHFIHHFAEEEQILFAPLKDDKVQRALNEHAVILNLVAEILSGSKQSGAKVFSDLADLVDGHVRYEERILFPHLEQQLSDAQLEEIGQKLGAEPIKDDYEDDFWVKRKSEK